MSLGRRRPRQCLAGTATCTSGGGIATAGLGRRPGLLGRRRTRRRAGAGWGRRRRTGLCSHGCRLLAGCVTAGELLLQPTNDRGFEGGGGRSYELPHVLRLRGRSCFRLRALSQARRLGPLPLLSLLRSGRGDAGPVSCRSCSLSGSHRVVMSASPLSGFGAGRKSDQRCARNTSPGDGAGPMDNPMPPSPDNAKSAAADSGMRRGAARRRAEAPPDHRLTRTRNARPSARRLTAAPGRRGAVQVGPAARRGLTLVDHVAVSPDEADQLALRCPLPAADAGAYGRDHGVEATQSSFAGHSPACTSVACPSARRTRYDGPLSGPRPPTTTVVWSQPRRSCCRSGIRSPTAACLVPSHAGRGVLQWPRIVRTRSLGEGAQGRSR